LVAIGRRKVTRALSVPGWSSAIALLERRQRLAVRQFAGDAGEDARQARQRCFGAGGAWVDLQQIDRRLDPRHALGVARQAAEIVQIRALAVEPGAVVELGRRKSAKRRRPGQVVRPRPPVTLVVLAAHPVERADLFAVADVQAGHGQPEVILVVGQWQQVAPAVEFLHRQAKIQLIGRLKQLQKHALGMNPAFAHFRQPEAERGRAIGRHLTAQAPGNSLRRLEGRHVAALLPCPLAQRGRFRLQNRGPGGGRIEQNAYPPHTSAPLPAQRAGVYVYHGLHAGGTPARHAVGYRGHRDRSGVYRRS
jgi:hypothetical protein